MTNLLLNNPGFESGNLNGWTSDLGNTPVIESTFKQAGSYSARIPLSSGGLTNLFTAVADRAIVAAARSYRFSLWVAGVATIAPYAFFYKADTTQISFVDLGGGSFVLEGTWFNFLVYVTAPALAERAAMYVEAIGPDGSFVYVDSAEILPTSMVSGVQSMTGVASITF